MENHCRGAVMTLFTGDGDEMNLKLVEDMYTFRRLSRLEPHLYALDLNKTRTISGYLKLPGPIVTTLANWLYKRK